MITSPTSFTHSYNLPKWIGHNTQIQKNSPEKNYRPSITNKQILKKRFTSDPKNKNTKILIVCAGTHNHAQQSTIDWVFLRHFCCRPPHSSPLTMHTVAVAALLRQKPENFNPKAKKRTGWVCKFRHRLLVQRKA